MVSNVSNQRLPVAEAFIDAALTQAGRRQFHDQSFREVFDRYVSALHTEANLNEPGCSFHRDRLHNLLSNRLMVEQWFDHHPEIGDESITAPVVVAGLPRTGTTMLHRTIATDSRFLSPLWYEVRYPVPIDDDFARQDRRIDIGKREVRAMLEAAPELAAIHPMDAMAPDEELMLLEHSFMSTVAESFAHLPDFGTWLYQQDQQPGYNYLKRLLQFLQWQKRQKGLSGDRWLLKTPHHLHYPNHLFETFPDARVIQTHRHPIEVIPSYGSMMYALISPYAATCDKVAIASHWTTKWQCGLEATMQFRDEAPDAPFMDLWFDDTVINPQPEIARVYDFIGSELTEKAATEMNLWQDMNRREKRPEHHYTLEEYGLSAAGLNARFASYTERYFSHR